MPKLSPVSFSKINSIDRKSLKELMPVCSKCETSLAVTDFTRSQLSKPNPRCRACVTYPSNVQHLARSGTTPARVDGIFLGIGTLKTPSRCFGCNEMVLPHTVTPGDGPTSVKGKHSHSCAACEGRPHCPIVAQLRRQHY